MKLLLRIAGILCLAIATLFFFYGTVKLFRAENKNTIELAPGIVARQQGPDQAALAVKGFSASACFAVIGVVLLFLSRGASKNKVPAQPESLAAHHPPETSLDAVPAVTESSPAAGKPDPLPAHTDELPVDSPEDGPADPGPATPDSSGGTDTPADAGGDAGD